MYVSSRDAYIVVTSSSCSLMLLRLERFIHQRMLKVLACEGDTRNDLRSNLRCFVISDRNLLPSGSTGLCKVLMWKKKEEGNQEK